MSETIRQSGGDGPEVLVDHIVGDLIGDRPVADDVALVVIRRRPVDG